MQGHHRRYYRRHRRTREERLRRHQHRFGPWRWEGRYFGRGELPLALLSLLSEGPQHGYQLMTALEERTDGCYQPSAGTIYPTLQQLLDQGRIRAQDEDGGRKVYELTDEGRAVLEREREHVEDIWARADDDDWGGWGAALDQSASEVIRPSFRLMREAARAIHHAPDSEMAEKVREILGRARDEIRTLRRERG